MFEQNDMATVLQPIESSEPGVPAWLEVVAQEASSIRFGVIQITVHDQRVVQVEKTERFRFDARAEAKAVAHPVHRKPGDPSSPTRSQPLPRRISQNENTHS